MIPVIHIKGFVAFVACTFLVLTVQTVQAQYEEPALEVNGFARNYMGVLFQNGDFSILQNTLDLTLQHKRENISFLANPYFYHYPTGENVFDFRALYMDIFTEKLDIRIGRQQIVWGQADGVFITDVVSPLNLTDFLLWDFNEIRIGVTAVKAKYYPISDHAIELVWIPVFTPSILPGDNSIWKPSIAFPAPPTFDYSNATVEANIANSEYFLRYTISTSAIDLQLIGAYSWDDLPTSHVRKDFDSTMNLTGITVSPAHHRLLMGGGNFSAPIGDFIVRGEGAYYYGKYFQTAEPTAVDALVQKNYVNYVVGLDRTLGEWVLSSQFIQKIVFDHEALMANERVDNLMTVMINRTLLREQLRLELFSYIGFNNDDALIRVRGFYFPFDGLGIELGTNIFVGEQGQFGQYNDNSMIYTRVKYSF
jgi:hypothetical protein